MVMAVYNFSDVSLDVPFGTGHFLLPRPEIGFHWVCAITFNTKDTRFHKDTKSEANDALTTQRSLIKE